MAKTLANLFSEIVKRSKISLEDKKTIKAASENSALSAIEIDDEEYDSILSNIHNLETAEATLKPKLEKSIKASFLDGIDSQIETIFGEGLADDEISALKGEKVTASKLRKAFELQKASLEKKLKAAKGSGDSNREMALEKEIADLNKEYKQAKDTFETQKNELIANHKKELFGVKLKQRITSKENIADEFKNARHFAENFGADLNDFLQKNKIEINPETEELLNSETKTKFFDKQQTERDLNWVLDSVVKEFGYEKKSITPQRGIVNVNEPIVAADPKSLVKGIRDANAKMNT
jgi:hypothetical protein